MAPGAVQVPLPSRSWILVWINHALLDSYGHLYNNPDLPCSFIALAGMIKLPSNWVNEQQQCAQVTMITTALSSIFYGNDTRLLGTRKNLTLGSAIPGNMDPSLLGKISESAKAVF